MPATPEMLRDAPHTYRLISDPPALSFGSAGSADGRAGADVARTWSRAECEALFQRIVGLTNKKGDTVVTIRLSWLGHLRWAQNTPTTSGGGVRNPWVVIRRIVGGTVAKTETNKLDDVSLKQVITQAEQRLQEMSADEAEGSNALPAAQQYLNPRLWSDTTFNVTYQGRSDAARAGADPAMEAKLVSGGYLATRVETWAIFSTKGLAAYAAGTMASYSETVRNPEGTGSGWAGLMHTDWSKLNPKQLSARALQKCVASANPRAIEPGRYTAILEPEAVGRFMIFAVALLDRLDAEKGSRSKTHPYSGLEENTTRIGQQILDERITISTDPMDPDGPYIPFSGDGYSYRPVTWIEKGVLKALAYDSDYAREYLEKDEPLLNPNAFRMSGGETSLEEMIATTERGVLVTRFGAANSENRRSLHISSVTRDGLWLVENGKIKFPVKNMRVLESPLFIGNSVLQLGKPERILGGGWSDNSALDLSNFTPMAFGNMPVIVPPMKVRDFNFTALADAV